MYKYEKELLSFFEDRTMKDIQDCMQHLRSSVGLLTDIKTENQAKIIDRIEAVENSMSTIENKLCIGWSKRLNGLSLNELNQSMQVALNDVHNLQQMCIKVNQETEWSTCSDFEFTNVLCAFPRLAKQYLLTAHQCLFDDTEWQPQ